MCTCGFHWITTIQTLKFRFFDFFKCPLFHKLYQKNSTFLTEGQTSELTKQWGTYEHKVSVYILAFTVTTSPS